MFIIWSFACSTPEQAPPAPTPAPQAQPEPTQGSPDPCASVAKVDAVPPSEDPSATPEAEIAQACAWEAKGGPDALAQAARYLRTAVEQSSSPSSHYLLARTIARQRALGPSAVCEHEAYYDEMLNHLAAAGADAALRAVMRDEPLFQSAQTAIRYRIAQGQTPAEIAAHAEGLVLYGPAAGVYGNVLVVELAPGGAALIRRRDIEQPANWLEERKSDAWKAEGNALHIDVGEGSVLLGVDPSGILREGAVTRFTDAMSECEA